MTALPYLVGLKNDGSVGVIKLGTTDLRDNVHTTAHPSKWNHLSSFLFEGIPYAFLYNDAEGTAGIDLINHDGSTSSQWRGTLERGWTTVMTITNRYFNKKIYLLLHQLGGLTVLSELHPTKGIIRELWRKTWSANWSHFVSFTPVSHTDSPCVYHYKAVEGASCIFVHRETDYSEPWSAGWERNITNFTVFDFSSKTYLINYSLETSKVNIDQITPGGTGHVHHFTWNKGITHLTSFEIDHINYLFSYNQVEGTVSVHRINDNLKGFTEVWTGKWANDWKFLVPFQFLDFPFEKDLDKYRIITVPDYSSWDDGLLEARIQGGRLPTNAEVKYWLGGRAYAPLVGRDTWVRTIDEYVNQEWLQIGDERWGKTHTEIYKTIPSWDGREHQDYKRFLLYIEKGTPLRLPNIEIHSVPQSSTWEELKEFAKDHGGRLPTDEEARLWLHGVAHSHFVGKDTWVPVVSSVLGGTKDWLQIGDDRSGRTHIRSHDVYPSWGDDHSTPSYKGFALVLREDSPPPALELVPLQAPSSWQDCKDYAAYLGGRLPTNDEVEKWLHGVAYAPLRGRDTWVPTYFSKEQRDWVQLGDSRFGKSHSILGGYPGWGDKREYHVELILIAKEGNPVKGPDMQLLTASNMTSWEDALDYANREGYVIPTINEVRQWLGGRSFVQLRGRDVWVPVYGDDGKRDWVEIGDNRFGHSGLEVLGNVAWCNNHEAGSFKGFILAKKGWKVEEKEKNEENLKALDNKKIQLEKDILVQQKQNNVQQDELLKRQEDIAKLLEEIRHTQNPTYLEREKFVVLAIPRYSSWDDYQDQAVYHGGRLPTNEEVRRWLYGMPFAGVAGRDIWVATLDKDGKKDWMQIGDNRYGFSHFELHNSYWDGTDKRDDQDFKGLLLYVDEGRQVQVPNIKVVKTYPSQTWEEMKEYARAHGGRLPTTKEVVAWLHGQRYAGFDGRDTWVPITLEDGQKQWMQIGDNRYGKDHGTYPGWGDSHEEQPWKGFGLIAYDTKEETGGQPPIELVGFKLPGMWDVSWDDCSDYAAYLGGRLPTNDEVNKWLNGAPYLPLRGRDVWVPSYLGNDQKDWIQIGDARFGQSHSALGGYPGWGDNRTVGVEWLVIVKDRQLVRSPFMELISVPNSTNWDDAKRITDYLGYRLPTHAEVKLWLHGNAYMPLRGKDVWIPVIDDDNKKDFVQIGDKRFGRSMIASEGYSNWAKLHDQTSWKGFLLVRRVVAATALELQLQKEIENLKVELEKAKKEEEEEKKRQEEKKREEERAAAGAASLPQLPEVNDAKERIKNNQPDGASLPHVDFDKVHDIVPANPIVVTDPPGFRTFEPFTENGNIVVSTPTSDGKHTIFEVVVPPGGKYGKDNIFYWENNTRKVLPVAVLPDETKRFAKSYEIKNAQTSETLVGATATLTKVGGSEINVEVKNGVLTLPNELPDGEYVLKVKVPGFTPLIMNGVIFANSYKHVPSLPAFLSKDLTSGERRIVLSWSAPAAKDLDLHLFTSNNLHVCFENKNKIKEWTESGVHYKLALDIDKRSGFGPETITLTNLAPGVKYSIVVNNFDNKVPLSSCGAKVSYFGETETVEVAVPNNGDKNSRWWFVGGLDDTGKLQPINKLIPDPRKKEAFGQFPSYVQ